MNFESEIDKKIRLMESFKFTEIMHKYMVDRLDLLNNWQLEDKPKNDSILQKHYEDRKNAMIIMVWDAIEHVQKMDDLYNA